MTTRPRPRRTRKPTSATWRPAGRSRQRPSWPRSWQSVTSSGIRWRRGSTGCDRRWRVSIRRRRAGSGCGPAPAAGRPVGRVHARSPAAAIHRARPGRTGARRSARRSAARAERVGDRRLRPRLRGRHGRRLGGVRACHRRFARCRHRGRGGSGVSDGRQLELGAGRIRPGGAMAPRGHRLRRTRRALEPPSLHGGHLAHVRWAIGRWDDADAIGSRRWPTGAAGSRRGSRRCTCSGMWRWVAEMPPARERLEEARELGDHMHELQRTSPAVWGLAELALATRGRRHSDRVERRGARAIGRGRRCGVPVPVPRDRDAGADRIERRRRGRGLGRRRRASSWRSRDSRDASRDRPRRGAGPSRERVTGPSAVVPRRGGRRLDRAPSGARPDRGADRRCRVPPPRRAAGRAIEAAIPAAEAALVMGSRRSSERARVRAR